MKNKVEKVKKSQIFIVLQRITLLKKSKKYYIIIVRPKKAKFRKGDLYERKGT